MPMAITPAVAVQKKNAEGLGLATLALAPSFISEFQNKSPSLCHHHHGTTPLACRFLVTLPGLRNKY